MAADSMRPFTAHPWVQLPTRQDLAISGCEEQIAAFWLEKEIKRSNIFNLALNPRLALVTMSWSHSFIFQHFAKPVGRWQQAKKNNSDFHLPINFHFG